MKALLLCASHNDLGLIRALKKLGYEIWTTGNIPGLIGEKYVDHYIQADYSDKELIMKIMIENKIERICPCCNDFGVYTAAYVAEQMKISGFDSYATTILLHNKDRFKEFAKKNEIPTPNSEMFEQSGKAKKYLKNVEYPIIVKPTDASAGNGIHKAENREEAEKAIDFAFDKSRANRIVIEPFVTGTQHGYCTFLVNEKIVACCSNNEYSIMNPYRVEIDTYPADNYSKVSAILNEQIEKIAHVLHLKDGIFHLQYIMGDKGPQIIEVMRRVLGNMYSVPGNALTGVDWDYWEVRARCGLSCKDFPKPTKQEGFYAYKTLLGEKNGEILDIRIPQKLEKYIMSTCMLKKKGDMLSKHESEPVGFLFLQFSSMGEMKKILIDEYQNNCVKM